MTFIFAIISYKYVVLRYYKDISRNINFYVMPFLNWKIQSEITLGHFSGAACPDALLRQKFHLISLFLIKILPCLNFSRIKILPCFRIILLKSVYLFFPRYISQPWLYFSFKNSFLILIFLLKVLFPSLLFYFYFIFSFLLVALPFSFIKQYFLNLWMSLT